MSSCPGTHEMAQGTASVRSNLVPCSITPQAEETITVSIFADMSTVTVKHPQTAQKKVTHVRGKITGFSRKSRKRMIEAMAKKRNYERPLFLTLTYPDEAWFGMAKTNTDFQMDLEAFLQRFRREYGDKGLIWRKEEEDRKSGRFIGHVVPHAHIIMDGILLDLAELRKNFRKWWAEIITDGHTEILKKGCRIDLQAAKSRRHAMYYVSKYVAKQAETDENYNPCQPVDSLGRRWGTIGNWNTSEAVIVRLTKQQYIQWKRLVSRWLKSKGSRFARSMARMSVLCGSSVFGLGDMSHPEYEDLYDSAVFKLLLHVQKLA